MYSAPSLPHVEGRVKQRRLRPASSFPASRGRGGGGGCWKARGDGSAGLRSAGRGCDGATQPCVSPGPSQEASAHFQGECAVSLPQLNRSGLHGFSVKSPLPVLPVRAPLPLLSLAVPALPPQAGTVAESLPFPVGHDALHHLRLQDLAYFRVGSPGQLVISVCPVFLLSEGHRWCPLAGI